MLLRLAYSEPFLKLSNLLHGQAGRLRHDLAWRPQLKQVDRDLLFRILSTFLTSFRESFFKSLRTTYYTPFRESFRESFFKSGLLGIFDLIMGVTCCCPGLYVILFVNIVKAGVLRGFPLAW